jgi:hypothetical protein
VFIGALLLVIIVQMININKRKRLARA